MQIYGPQLEVRERKRDGGLGWAGAGCFGCGKRKRGGELDWAGEGGSERKSFILFFKKI